jgi:ATP-dependent RNA helicase DDX24/MAK5
MAKKSKSSKAKLSTKAASWASLPWSKVQVTNECQSENDNDKFVGSSSNHYDNPDTADPSELYDVSSTKSSDYIEGANDPGIFLGLEVVDGSRYSVEKIPVMNPITREATGGFVTKLVIRNSDESSEFKHSTDADTPSEEPTQSSRRKRKQKDKVREENDPKDETGEKKSNTSTSTMEDGHCKELEMHNEKTQREEKKRKFQDSRPQKVSDSDDRSIQVLEQSKDGDNSSRLKKKLKRPKTTQNHSGMTEDSNLEIDSSAISSFVTQEQIESIRIGWSVATGGVYLHPKLCRSLYRLGFISPTPNQSSTLAASILGKRDIVGAAPTGSVSSL